MTIGEKVRLAVSFSNLSVKEIAEKLDTTTQNIYKLFKKDSIDSKYLENIAQLLDLSPSHFFNESVIEKAKTEKIETEIKLLNDGIELLKSENKTLKDKNIVLLEKLNDAQEKYIQIINEKTELLKSLGNLNLYTPQELFAGNHLTDIYSALNIEKWGKKKKELIARFKSLLEENE